MSDEHVDPETGAIGEVLSNSTDDIPYDATGEQLNEMLAEVSENLGQTYAPPVPLFECKEGHREEEFDLSLSIQGKLIAQSGSICPVCICAFLASNFGTKRVAPETNT